MPIARHHPLIPVATILLLLPVVARAADPPPSTSTPSATHAELPQLLKQLDADTRAERLAAERRLLELGPAVLPQLPPPELLPSAAVRDAVARVRNELELRRAHALGSQPSRVTARGSKTINDWFAEISRQTDNAIDLASVPAELREKELTLNFDGAPFWQAIEQIVSRPEISLRLSIDEKTNSLTFSRPDPRRVQKELLISTAGAYRVSLFPAGRYRVIGDAQQRQLLRIQMGFVPEPRLRPLFLQFAARDISVATSSGPLQPFNALANYDLPFNAPSRECRLELDYYLPAGDTATTVDFRGRFFVTTAAGSEQIRFTELKKLANEKNPSIARRRGGVTVTLQNVTFARDAFDLSRIRVTVAYDAGGPAFESHRAWMLHNNVYLETSYGTRREPNGGFETTFQADGATGIEYRFRDLPAAADFTFVYAAPTLIIDVPVEVELKWVR